MAKKSTKKKSSRNSPRKSPRKSSRSRSIKAVNAEGKHLVIVESPTKARTINKYLGPEYVVMASVGHVRDLPRSAPKGKKRSEVPVPGVDLEHDFEPTYEVMPDSKKTVAQLKKAAKQAVDVWFATDLDREGEAIAWHLAEALGVPVNQAKRVVFNAITKAEIGRAFETPRGINQNKVDAQQARRILDRIVGYQVSPLLWKKVAGGLSAGRVQSVATRLVVEREREIDAFVPDEYWKITGIFATQPAKQAELATRWNDLIKPGDADHAVSIKDQNAWLSDHECLRAELQEFRGRKFNPDHRDVSLEAAKALGFLLTDTRDREDDKAKGPAKHPVTFLGKVAEDAPDYKIRSIETKRTTSRPSPPFITSTLQQQAANRLGFKLRRTMQVAQQLYEGIDLKGGRGPTGLITYMRTDSTFLSNEAVSMARGFIKTLGDNYLPDKPNFYKSSNKSAQEAHEAIRPTDVNLRPSEIKSYLNDEQFKLYDLIWRRFVACQMTPAQWDSTTILIDAHADAERGSGSEASGFATFKATGRKLVFDGFLKITGLPKSDDVILPELQEEQPVAPIQIDPTQHFTSPPPRYSEASLQKKLEEEGIGRPSTYASIIQTIQDRKYVESLTPRDKRMRATDLGMVVTDMLGEAFPTIMDVPYTRQMEAQLDEIEEEHADWRQMLHAFYKPFKLKLDSAHETLQHAKATTEPAPDEYRCEKCGAPTEYRFGKNGRFLSCTRYPDCKYAAPIDREGKPQAPEETDILDPIEGRPMIRRTGRFGPFLGAQGYPEVQFILKLDPKTGAVVLPKPPPLTTDLTCPKCEEHPLYLRDSKRGLWLSCSNFPKCRGRLAWKEVDEAKQTELEAAYQKHLAENPVPELRTSDGHVIGEDETYIPRILGEDVTATSEAEADDALLAT